MKMNKTIMEVENQTRYLSKALQLIDDYTKEKAIGDIKLTLIEQKIKPVKNLDGFYMFFDLQKGKYNLKISSEFYFDKEESIEINPNLTKKPYKERINESSKIIILKPKPCYPFSNGATLIRGTVTNKKHKPVPAAKIEIVSKGISSETTSEGEYVLYFNPIKKEDIDVKDGKTYVKGDNGIDINLRIDKSGFRVCDETIQVLEGGVTIKYITL